MIDYIYTDRLQKVPILLESEGEKTKREQNYYNYLSRKKEDALP